MSSISNFNPHIVGAIEIGTVLSVLLHGVFWTQLYSYYSQFPKDPLITKLVVGVIWLASLAQSCCNVVGLYTMTIVSFGRVPNVSQAFPIGSLFSALVQALVQLVYLHRMYRFSGRLVVPAICCLVTTFNFVGTLIFRLDGVKLQTIQDTEAHRRHWGWLIYTVYASTAVIDVAIAAIIAYYLHQRRQTAMAATSRLVDTLIRWTLETGLITSLFALAVIVTFAINSSNNIWLALYMTMTNVYAITLLALLNRRTTLLDPKPKLSSIQAENFVTSIAFSQRQVDPGMDMVKMENVHHHYGTRDPLASTSSV